MKKNVTFSFDVEGFLHPNMCLLFDQENIKKLQLYYRKAKVDHIAVPATLLR